MRLASKGRSLADSSYDSEVKSIQAFLSMQHPAPAPVLNPESLDIQPEHYLSPRYTRRIRGKVWMGLCISFFFFFLFVLCCRSMDIQLEHCIPSGYSRCVRDKVWCCCCVVVCVEGFKFSGYCSVMHFRLCFEVLCDICRVL